MALVGLTIVDTYEAATVALEAAGYRKDGIPMGGTWRTAAKMSDTDLLAALRIEEPNYEVVDRY